MIYNTLYYHHQYECNIINILQLDEVSVPLIKATIVCGGANNQLVDPRTDYGMHAKGRGCVMLLYYHHYFLPKILQHAYI